jgi:hypothetical protein
VINDMAEAGMLLKLGQDWTLGEWIGGGGFGVVHVAESANQEGS